MPEAISAQERQLEDAFQLFNQVSEQLVDSYSQLQHKVAQLGSELAASRSERMLQLAEKERLANRLEQLLDALPAAVMVIDGDHRVRQFNPTAAALIPNLALAAHWPTLYQAAFDHEWAGDELKLRSGQLVSMTQRLLTPEPGYILLLLDVTETRELQVRVERQKRLTAMGEMTAQLAHQIRTPLTSALLYSSHLARDDLTPGQRQRFSDRCRARLIHMEHQINDMLAFSRGENYRDEPVNLSELLSELAQTLEPLATDNAMTLVIRDLSQGEAVIHGNRDALLGAFTNIASNALEHGDRGNRVQIDLQQQPQGWWLRFSDNGPGIPTADRQQIFDPFFTTRSGGTGLGLAVAQSVILGHGGEIEVESNPLGGSCFTVSVPRRGKGDHGDACITMTPAEQNPVVVRYSA